MLVLLSKLLAPEGAPCSRYFNFYCGYRHSMVRVIAYQILFLLERNVGSSTAPLYCSIHRRFLFNAHLRGCILYSHQSRIIDSGLLQTPLMLISTYKRTKTTTMGQKSSNLLPFGQHYKLIAFWWACIITNQNTSLKTPLPSCSATEWEGVVLNVCI